LKKPSDFYNYYFRMPKKINLKPVYPYERLTMLEYKGLRRDVERTRTI